MWNRESGTLESRMPLTIGIRNPSFIEKDLESIVTEILIPGCGIQTPRMSWIPLHKAMQRRENQHGGRNPASNPLSVTCIHTN